MLFTVYCVVVDEYTTSILHNTYKHVEVSIHSYSFPRNHNN